MIDSRDSLIDALPEDLTPDEEFISEAALRLTRWQEADRDPANVHAENSRLALWRRLDGRTFLTATTGQAAVAVDCTGYGGMLPYEAVHPRVARVLEAETHPSQAVDLNSFWEWLGRGVVNGACRACSHRFGKVWGSPYNLGALRGALDVVYDFLDRDSEADWRRIVEPPTGDPRYRGARLESDGQYIIAFLSLNVETKMGRFAPEWPRDYEVTDG